MNFPEPFHDLLQRLSKRMWVRTSLYCALGVVAALVGAFFIDFNNALIITGFLNFWPY